MSENPFQGPRPPEIYELLIDDNNDLPTWPDEKFQRGYVSSRGQGVVRKTQYFIDMLDEDGAFVPGWRGLDYGAGWDRIASLMLSKGGAEQLDLVDGLDNAMRLLEAGGFENRRWKVSEILQPGEIPEEEYNFVYAFSVFTHLPPHVFANNLSRLTRGLKSPGNVYLTVAGPRFRRAQVPRGTREERGSARCT